MDELNACTECGFTTTVYSEFQGHIEKHEIEHSRSSSGEMSNSQSIEWTEGSQSATPSPRSTPPTDPTPSPNSSEQIAISEITNLLNKKEPSTKTPKQVHICPHCNFTTCMSQHMKSHLEAHERHQGQMYQCDVCKMQFSQKANMHRHRMRHSGVKPYECRFCKKRFFRKDQMQEHSMTHIKTGFGFDCPVAHCTMQFSQHNSLRTHLEETHVISSGNQASCKRCNLMFANSRRLLLHYQTRHDESEQSNSSPAKRESTPKRKKLSANVSESSSLSFSEQLQNLVKSDFVGTTSENPIMNTDYDLLAQNFPSSQDLLMLCLQNISQGQFPSFGDNLPQALMGMSNFQLPLQQQITQAVPQTVPNPIKQESVQLWSEQTSSSVSVSAPSPSEQSHSPSAELSKMSTPKAGTPDNAPKDLSIPKKEEIEVDGEEGEEEEEEDINVMTEKSPSPEKEEDENVECNHCGLMFFDNTMYLLHKSLHAEGDPFRCALCGTQCGEKYMFTTHIIFADHNTNTNAPGPSNSTSVVTSAKKSAMT
ncbi:unnamed protein product [Caenorhabditis angaria]|uniref:C2H2-type domain-containing protein n=1 Tax=Caenorhabditis angaria TaxID=860376 RepID=A0A9P1IZT3_9PELO|nr:unnamed protein product [Caenorhabditis angaria]